MDKSEDNEYFDVANQVRHELAIKELDKRLHDCECVQKNTAPILAYIESEIKLKQERAEFFRKTSYNIAGWTFMGFITWVGFVISTVVWPALMTKLREYLGGF